MSTLESFIDYCDNYQIANEGFLTSVKNKIKKILLSIIRGLKKLLSKGKDNKIKRGITNLLNRAERLLTKCDKAETKEEIEEVKKETDQIQEEANQIQKESDDKTEVSDNSNGDKIVYQNDGKTVYFIKKPDGTKISYQNDGKTIKYIEKPDGTKTFYQKDGKTIYAIEKPDGTYTWYQEDGKTIRAVEKQDGTKISYQNDGKTIRQITKPDGTKTYYQEDKKVDTSTKKTNNKNPNNFNSVIKKYVDAKDKKSLKYIFADSLDVDPTFVNYQEAYNYVLHNFPEAFEENKDLTPFENDPSKYNLDYYVKLKNDFEKNPSKERFQQMRKVVKVTHADKIKRLIKERSMKKN